MPISTNHQDFREKVVAANDALFAEPVKIFFLKGQVADPDRTNVQIDAVLRTSADKPETMEGGRSDDWLTNIAAGKAILAIDRAAYAGPVPRTGDKVQALSRKGTPFFEVLHVNDRDHVRLILSLGEA